MPIRHRAAELQHPNNTLTGSNVRRLGNPVRTKQTQCHDATSVSKKIDPLKRLIAQKKLTCTAQRSSSSVHSHQVHLQARRQPTRDHQDSSHPEHQVRPPNRAFPDLQDQRSPPGSSTGFFAAEAASAPLLRSAEAGPAVPEEADHPAEDSEGAEAAAVVVAAAAEVPAHQEEVAAASLQVVGQVLLQGSSDPVVAAVVVGEARQVVAAAAAAVEVDASHRAAAAVDPADPVALASDLVRPDPYPCPSEAAACPVGSVEVARRAANSRVRGCCSSAKDPQSQD